MHARRSITATTTAFAALLLTAAALSGCDDVDRAMDCARTATTIAGDVHDVESTIQDPGQASDATKRQATVKALDKVHADLKDLAKRSDDNDLDSAVSDLDTAVRNARSSAANGHNPDMKPVAKAAGHLTRVCAGG